MRIPFIGGAYAGRSPNVDVQQLINYYIEGDPKDTRTPRYAVPRGGLALATAVASAQGRALYAFNDSRLFAVVGNTLYEINVSTFALTNRGTLATSTGRCMMEDNGAANGHQIMVTDSSGNGYVFDTNANTFTQLTNGTNGWPSGMSGNVVLTWQDGYGLFNQPGTGEFWWTAAYNFASIPGLQFATAEACPDNLLSIISDGTKVFLYGYRTTEVWYDAGLQNQAFVRIPAAVFPIGIAGPYARTKADNSIIFLGVTTEGQAKAYQQRGAGVPVGISDQALSYQLTKLVAAEQNAGTSPICLSFELEGHTFVTFTFPTSNVTYVWDAVYKEWFQWQSYNGSSQGAWSPIDHAYFSGASLGNNGAHFFLDFSGNLLMYSDSGTTDNSQAITYTIQSPHFYHTNDYLRVEQAQVVIAGAPASGTMTLSWSKDYGSTFGTGVTFNLNNTPTSRYYFNRLGRSRDWVFKLTTTSNPIIMDLLVKTSDMDVPQMPGQPK